MKVYDLVGKRFVSEDKVSGFLCYLCTEGSIELLFVFDKYSQFLNKVEDYRSQRLESLKIIGNLSKFVQFEEVYGLFKNADKDSIKLIKREHNFDFFYDTKTKKLNVSRENFIPPVQNNLFQQKPSKTKVMVVDDSKTILSLLNSVLKTDSSIEVCALVEDPLKVEEFIKVHNPDVLTLDIHMPGINGVELFKKIYPKYNIPTIMISSLSINEGPLVLEALEFGAFDYIQKPKLEEIKNVGNIILEKVKAAHLAKAALRESQMTQQCKFNTEFGFDRIQGELEEKLVLIGSSTGGTNAISDVLKQLPPKIPPILIVQHIPPVFSAAFANRLNEICDFTVKEAEDGEEIKINHVYIAKGGIHMGIKKLKGKRYIEFSDTEPVNRFKPSVDYMFNSVANCLAQDTIGIILTGMGDDGAKGLLKLKSLGVETIGQDKESSVVYGMPRAAFELGGVKYVEPLHNIAKKLIQIFNKKIKSKAS